MGGNSPRFAVGSSVALRDVIGGKVWTARAARVVRDTDSLVALCMQPGSPARVPGAYDPFGAQDRAARSELLAEAQRGDWELRAHTWQRTRLLLLLEPDLWYSVNLFFEPDGARFLCWYINFQDPFRRSSVGFDTRDLALDLVVAPDRTWGWKDEDEFADLVERGLLAPEQERLVRRAGDDVLALVEARRPPFDDTWTAWRPDAGWGLPELPEGWQRVDASRP